jgi:hypothetical protein
LYLEKFEFQEPWPKACSYYLFCFIKLILIIFQNRYKIFKKLILILFQNRYKIFKKLILILLLDRYKIFKKLILILLLNYCKIIQIFIKTNSYSFSKLLQNHSNLKPRVYSLPIQLFIFERVSSLSYICLFTLSFISLGTSCWSLLIFLWLSYILLTFSYKDPNYIYKLSYSSCIRSHFSKYSDDSIEFSYFSCSSLIWVSPLIILWFRAWIFLTLSFNISIFSLYVL